MNLIFIFFLNVKKNTYTNSPIHVIELKIESNSGNKEYTCLYKFRVHGKLFELNQREKKGQLTDAAIEYKKQDQENNGEIMN